MPSAWNSSASQPMPTPRMKRPPLSRSSVATVLASTRGLCSGTRQIPVAILILLVQAAVNARVVNGSANGVSVGIGNSPAEYGYFEPYFSKRMTCSGAHILAKPNRSAAVAIGLIQSDVVSAPIPSPKYPKSIVVLPDRLSAARYDLATPVTNCLIALLINAPALPCPPMPAWSASPGCCQCCRLVCGRQRV